MSAWNANTIFILIYRQKWVIQQEKCSKLWDHGFLYLPTLFQFRWWYRWRLLSFGKVFLWVMIWWCMMRNRKCKWKLKQVTWMKNSGKLNTFSQIKQELWLVTLWNLGNLQLDLLRMERMQKIMIKNYKDHNYQTLISTMKNWIKS